MNTRHFSLILGSIAALSVPLSAQRFDATIYGQGLNGTVGLIQGATSNAVTVGGSYANPTTPTPFATIWNGLAWSLTLPGSAVQTTGIGGWGPAANGDMLWCETNINARVRRWSASSGTWTQFPALVTAAATCVREWNGDVLVGVQGLGFPGLLRWNNPTNTWAPFGAATGQILTGNVLGVAPRGSSLLAYGTSLSAPGFSGAGLALWNGTSWSAIPIVPTSPTSYLEYAAVLANGDIVGMQRTPGLGTTPPYALYRFDGTSWRRLASGLDAPVRSVVELPDGNLVIGGTFTTIQGVATTALARFNGTSWSAIANLQGVGGVPAMVHDLRLLSDDVLACGGYFTAINGTAVSGIAGFRASVRGSVAQIGTGCVGSGGLNTLSPLNQPLIGKTYSALAGGIGNPLFLFLTRSLTPIAPVPLSVVFPNAPASCNIYVAADYTEVIAAPGTSTFTLSFAVPPSLSLVGTSILQQLTYFEVDPVTSQLAPTSTNGQNITFGRF